MSQHHSHHTSHSNKSLWIVIGSLVVILSILFGLNSFLTKENKNNVDLINRAGPENYLKGDLNAKVRLTEYADFQCPACAAYSPVINKLYNDINSEYGPSSLSVVYKYFPLIQIHKNAMISAQSAEAAGMQGKFWEMHDILFKNQNEWGEALDAKIKIEDYAKELSLDMAKFRFDRDSQNVVNKVTDSYKEGNKIGINHTPTIFLNGIEVTDPKGYDGLKAEILKLLNVSSSAVNNNASNTSPNVYVR